MSTLIYVHGTNGSGKSTLARRVGVAAGGFGGQHRVPKNKRAFWTTTPADVSFVGRYGNKCGGVDGVQPYAAVFQIMQFIADNNEHAFAEGLITPGVESCKRMAGMFEDHTFIALAVPIEVCVQHVVQRRAAARNIKPYDPANLIKKAGTVLSWADRLAAQGLHVKLLDPRSAYRHTLELLGLREPSVEDLLGA